MGEAGIRALKQNASAVVARAAGGEPVIITDWGRPPQMTSIPDSALQGMLDSGRARPPRRDIRELPAPEPGPCLSDKLSSMREAERY